jgi:hypothetical protein
MPQEYIEIRGARENNLKNVSLRIPKRKITMTMPLIGRWPLRTARLRRLSRFRELSARPTGPEINSSSAAQRRPTF